MHPLTQHWHAEFFSSVQALWRHLCMWFSDWMNWIETEFWPLPIQQWRRASSPVCPQDWHLPLGWDFQDPGPENQSPNCAPPGRKTNNEAAGRIICSWSWSGPTLIQWSCCIKLSIKDSSNKCCLAHQAMLVIWSLWSNRRVCLTWYLFCADWRRGRSKCAALWPT